MMMMTIFFAFEGSSGSSRVTHRTDNGQALDDIVGSFEANEPIIVRVAQSPHLLSSVSSLFIPPTLATQPFAICCSSTSKHWQNTFTTGSSTLHPQNSKHLVFTCTCRAATVRSRKVEVVPVSVPVSTSIGPSRRFVVGSLSSSLFPSLSALGTFFPSYKSCLPHVNLSSVLLPQLSYLYLPLPTSLYSSICTQKFPKHHDIIVTIGKRGFDSFL
ncbi:hypothetical protein B0H65DRAFT_125429 [Neurospora tetraspora]|uniref:Uncharacterized protein n=1 Tax=Neurospora tetraspora TaxID=94610 RepID=A0AAE0MV94_9PEZI|nr:hypothetical protein B0H65DRAFT_125429 [Neurospora tetraspora]